MGNETKSNSSISFPTLLFLVFLILKLCGVIDWSWWWVTVPLWGVVVFAVVMSTIVIFFKKPEPTIWDRLKQRQSEQEELLKQLKKK